MKIKVKDAFPFSLSEVLDKLGISPSCVGAFKATFPPHYKTKRTARYARMPEGVEDFRKVVKLENGAAGLAPAFQDPRLPLFVGSEEECAKIVLGVMREWWALPKGKEVEAYIERNHGNAKATQQKGRKK